MGQVVLYNYPIMIILYGILLFALGIYSYFLIDPNITFFQSNYWVQFRNWTVYLGYYRRDISWVVYLALVLLLFIFHFLFIKKYKSYSAVSIAALIALFGVISYPFISHDLFNYMFDARILTHYGQNPYFFKALDFPHDLWIRFMHWTDRTYPYGPTFLPLTLIPSFFGFGKFSLTFYLFKIFNGTLYVIAVYLLNKNNKKIALFFATHPIIIIEGIINTHNDLIAVTLGLIGIFLLGKKRQIWARILLLFSIGIKYITLPIIFLYSKTRTAWYTTFLFVMQIALVVYVCYRMEIQPWYFISLFVFVPYFPEFLEKLSILFFGLLMSYYPYIRLGIWTVDRIALKRELIFISLFICIIWQLLYTVLLPYFHTVFAKKKN